MADNEKGSSQKNNEKGTEWEVVSLTASAYAASPGPNPFPPPVKSKKEEDNDELMTSSAIFASHHFVFPPYGPKNLMIEPDCSEVVVDNVYPVEDKHTGVVNQSDASNNQKLKSGNDLPGIEFFSDKGKNLDDHGVEFGEGKKALEGLSIVGDEGIHTEPSFSEFPAKTADVSQSVLYDESSATVEPNDPSAIKPSKENKLDEGGFPPCEAWWKKHAMSLYNHAKESSPLWSIIAAAAMVGFVVLGQRWHREKIQLQQHHKWVTVKDESLGVMLGTFNRFKDILVGSHPRTPLIHGAGVSNYQGI